LVFVPVQKCLKRHLALNEVKLFGWLKKFGPAQNVLGPVKGQGISDTDSLKLVAPKKKLETFRLKTCHKQFDAL
jgi:hypothetical protein